MLPAWRLAQQVSVSPVQRIGVFAQDLVQGLPELQVSASLAKLAGVFSQTWAQAWVQGLPEPQVSVSPVQQFGFFSQAQVEGLPEPLFADLAPLTVPVWVVA